MMVVNRLLVFILMICTMGHAFFSSRMARAIRASSKSYAGGFGTIKREGEDAQEAMSSSEECACYSSKPYSDCCKPFHTLSRYPDQPEKLVRSRFSAFALGKKDYIMLSTHTEHPDYVEGKSQKVVSVS